MKYFDWSEVKNTWLKLERGVCFEDVLTAIDGGQILSNIDHPHQVRYPHQKVFVVEIDQYVYIAPYVEDDEKIFLKTIYPSRKMTKKYLNKRRQS